MKAATFTFPFFCRSKKKDRVYVFKRLLKKTQMLPDQAADLSFSFKSPILYSFLTAGTAIAFLVFMYLYVKARLV